MPKRGTAEPSARERLLASADELFYREGVQAVGIDRIIRHAGVAKASLYNIFGSKEGLVRSYLESRHAATRERVSQALTGLHPRVNDCSACSARRRDSRAAHSRWPVRRLHPEVQ